MAQATLDVSALAQELIDAHASGRTDVTPPSSRYPGFSLATAYDVGAEITRRRRAGGAVTVGRKIGHANKAVWRVLKLDTVTWAPMYASTVRDAAAAAGGSAAQDPPYVVGPLRAPKIEPEIVFKLRSAEALASATPLDAAEVLEHVEWLALGFEIVECMFADWKVQPPDFVAAFGLHAGLVVGEPRPVAAEDIPSLVTALAQCQLRLSKDGAVVEEGGGRNVLRSPALALGELAAGLSRQRDAEPLAAGEIVTTGSMTGSTPIAPGETWSADLVGLDLPALTLRTR